ncbi:MAG: hypothetical protein WCP45_05355 [Verrucomicrobiota bacterium]
MNRTAESPPDSLGMGLPLAVSGLAAWQALPSLIEAWNHDLYSRGAALAFAIWLVTPGWLYFKNRHAPAPASAVWLVLALLLCAAGAMSGLRVLQHLALACAVAGLPGWRRGACGAANTDRLAQDSVIEGSGQNARATVARACCPLSVFTPTAALAKLTALGVAVVAALAWLPASGWFLSHWQVGGLSGWERPVVASLMAFFLLALSRVSHCPPHSSPPAP